MRIAGFTALALFGFPCIFFQPASASEWTEINEYRSPLIFYGPGLKEAKKIFKRNNLLYLGAWTNPASRFPRAEFFYQTLKPSYSFTQEGNVTEMTKKWNFLKKNYVDMGDEGEIWNAFGKTSYVTFSIDDNSCVGLSRYFGNTKFHEGTPRVGTMLLTGYYCFEGKKHVDKDLAEQLASAIGIRGEDEPVRPDGY